MQSTVKLPEGYEIRDMSEEEFRPLWKKPAREIFFDNSQIFEPSLFLSEEEKEKERLLGEQLGKPYRLNLALFYRGEFAGWCSGQQESAETFYMRNSAILPAHRRKGLYTALLARTMEVLKEKGFQKIYSRHTPTNNDILIPKLKFGFVISSFEISDTLGLLVHLTYYPKKLRHKIMVYRTGDLKPDEEIRAALRI